MVIEILLNNKIQTFFTQMNLHHWKKINSDLLIFSFGQNMNKILNIKSGICAMFTMKHSLNKMHPTKCTYQMGWFVG